MIVSGNLVWNNYKYEANKPIGGNHLFYLVTLPRSSVCLIQTLRSQDSIKSIQWI